MVISLRHARQRHFIEALGVLLALSEAVKPMA
jgi:hypothetical protein